MPFYFLYGLQAAHNDDTFENIMVLNPMYEARSLGLMVCYIKVNDIKNVFFISY